MTAPPWPEAVGGLAEPRFIDRLQDAARQLLDDRIFRAAYPEGPRRAILLRDFDPAYRLGPIRHLAQLLVEPLEVVLQRLPIHRLGHSIDSGRLGAIKRLEAGPQVLHREVVHQGRKRCPWLPACPSGDGLDTGGRRGSTSACGRRGPRVLDAMCPPLLSGHYSASSLIWGHPTSDAPSGLLPVCRLCHPTPTLEVRIVSPEF